MDYNFTIPSDQYLITGAGGGGGKGGGGGGYEAADTLINRQYAKILFAITEGPIAGLVAGLRSVYINGVPLQNADGTYNFIGVSLQFRDGATVNKGTGVVSQASTTLVGFDTQESATSIQAMVRAGVPITHTILSPNVGAARVSISCPDGMVLVDSNGNTNGNSVAFQIDMKTTGGTWTPVGLATKTAVATATGATNIATTPAGCTFIDAHSTSVPAVKALGCLLQYRLQAAVGAPVAAWVTAPGTITSVASRVLGMNPVTRRTAWMTIQTTTHPGITLPAGVYECQFVDAAGTTYPFTSNCKIPDPVLVIAGKATNKYIRDYLVSFSGLLPSQYPIDLKVTRLSPDSVSVKAHNSIMLDTVTSIVYAPLAYPYTAIAGLQIDSRNFSQVPTVGFDCKLRVVQVPSNYFPEKVIQQVAGQTPAQLALQRYTRNPLTGADMGTYQVWDGTFYLAWTDNPAWCFYDLLTNSRYGLGGHLDYKLIDVATLYTIAKYCDEPVPDGHGGWEARFTCNVWMNTREDAYRVMSNMASVFRAMVYWDSVRGLTAIQDSPGPITHLFTNANVLDGEFNYSGSASQARHNVALVSWDDPTQYYRTVVEYIEDREALLNGAALNKVEVTAFGCTSRGQAHRLGQWILFSEKLETSVCSFKTGVEGTTLYPGQIINIIDKFRSGARNAGRIAGSTLNTVVLDAPVDLQLGQAYTLLVQQSQGTPWAAALPVILNQQIQAGNNLYNVTTAGVLGAIQPDHQLGALANGTAVLTYIGNSQVFQAAVTTNLVGGQYVAMTGVNTLTIATPFTTLPANNTIWLLYSASLQPQTFRVLSIIEENKGMYTIAAIEHNASKFDFVEKGAPFVVPPVSVVGAAPGPITGITVTPATYKATTSGLLADKLVVAWNAEPSSSKYLVSYKENGLDTVTLPEVTNNYCEISPVTLGATYTITVVGINALGQKGP